MNGTSASSDRCRCARFVVFRAKLTALLMFAGLFTAAAHVSLLPLTLLTSFNPWGEHNVLLRLIAWAIASVAGSAFAVLTVTAVVGALVLALSRSQLQSLSTFMRSMVLGLLVVCLPLVSHLPTLGGALSSRAPWMLFVPPAWFLGFQRTLQGLADSWLVQLGVVGLLATLLAATVVGVTYLVLFRQFERLMLRPAPTSAPWWRADRLSVRIASVARVRRRLSLYGEDHRPQPAASGRARRPVGMRHWTGDDLPDVGSIVYVGDVRSVRADVRVRRRHARGSRVTD